MAGMRINLHTTGQVKPIHKISQKVAEEISQNKTAKKAQEIFPNITEVQIPFSLGHSASPGKIE